MKNQCRVLTKEMTWLWLYFKVVSQSGWIREEKKHCVQKDWKFKRTLSQESRQIDFEGPKWAVRVRMREGRSKEGNTVSACTAALISVSLTLSASLSGPSWSSDSPRFCFFPYPSILPLPSGNPDIVGQCLFSAYLPAVRGRPRSFLPELLFR